MPSSNATMSDPQAFLETIGAGKKALTIPKGRNVFSQGDPADTLFYLQQGRVKMTVANDEGKEAVVGLIEAGQFFGQGYLRGAGIAIARLGSISLELDARNVCDRVMS